MRYTQINMQQATGKRLDLGLVNDRYIIDVRSWENVGLTIRSDGSLTAGFTVSVRYSYDGLEFYDYSPAVSVTTETPFSLSDVSAVAYIAVIVTTAGTSGEMVNVVGILKSSM